MSETGWSDTGVPAITRAKQDSVSKIESFPVPGVRPPGVVASFTYDVAEDRWTWSDQLYELHGYHPGEIPATTSALMHHKHPEDRERAAGVFAATLRDGGTYSCYHRIVTRDRRVLSAVSVGVAVPDAEGRTATVEGYYIDLTDARRHETESDVQHALARKAQGGPTIEQAKGIIMLALGCTEDEAFARLRTASEHANRKVTDIARDLVDAVAGGRMTGEMVSLVLDQLVAASGGRVGSA
jgi:hypothetical protein